MHRLLRVVIAAGLVSAFSGAAAGQAVTYQGRLVSAGAPANGPHDFEFRVFEFSSGGSALGNVTFLSNVPVTDGLFTAELNAGAGVFTGGDRWVEIRVKPAGPFGYTTLSPRQKV